MVEVEYGGKAVPLLRPAQRRICRFRGGRMGVIAVPGSGKTFTLSYLAAELLSQAVLEPGQEVLVVTLVNSAVDNFSQRVKQFLAERSLLPLDYRVRTLHGLAVDIVRERPDLVGLAENFQVIDEREGERIIQEVCTSWAQNHAGLLEQYLKADLEPGKGEWVLRSEAPKLVIEVGGAFIRMAKDYRLTPPLLRARLDELPIPLPLAEMGCAIYTGYQRALAYRAAIDFDDMIRLALDALEWDPHLLEKLRWRWPYILEDEAQDSSRLQELILEMLAGGPAASLPSNRGWVRVGDPNQAIYETFTTANPRYLREFVEMPDVVHETLPNSGRSTQSIIDLANHLAGWASSSHPVAAVRDAMANVMIEPVPAGDTRPNPVDDPARVRLILQKFTANQEIQAVAKSLENWLGDDDNKGKTVAVLTPRSKRGEDLVQELKHRGLPVVDSLLKSSSATRASAGALRDLLICLADPASPAKLANAFKAWMKVTYKAHLSAEKPPSELEHGAEEDDLVTGLSPEEISEALAAEIKTGAAWLGKFKQVEDFLWPALGDDLVLHQAGSLQTPLPGRLVEFRTLLRRWQAAVLLPVSQVVLTLGQDIFSSPAELALTHKLALLLRQASLMNPGWRLPELAGELGVIAQNERRFLGFSDEDTGFNPDNYANQVVVSTIHKAKGLEWDRVYLISVNNYDFPSGEAYDTYMSEKWYIRDNLNLPAEALAQLEAAVPRAGSGPLEWASWYEEGAASSQARLDYVRERLRLLYVGITRARRELVITWNTGRQNNLVPAAAFVELAKYWEETHREPTP